MINCTRYQYSQNKWFISCLWQDHLTLNEFLNRRNKDRGDRDNSISLRAILTPGSTKQKRPMRRDISMKELKDAEIRGMSNKMFENVDEGKQDSDVEDGSFMVQIPKSVSKTNIVEQDYMTEVRR